MDVGKYRGQPTIQAQPFMARGRHEVKHTHMGHGRLVQQEKGSRFMRSRMDHILQQNRAKFDRHILGEISIGKFILCRNAWPMCLTSTRQSAFRSLKDSGVGIYLVLRQQKSSRAIRIHPSKDTAQCKVRRYTTKPQGNEAHF
jgi:hypothetical protein